MVSSQQVTSLGDQSYSVTGPGHTMEQPVSALTVKNPRTFQYHASDNFTQLNTLYIFYTVSIRVYLTMAYHILQKRNITGILYITGSAASLIMYIFT
jgi:hypothetical protein